VDFRPPKWPNPNIGATLYDALLGIQPENDPYNVMNPRLAKALGYVEGSISQVVDLNNILNTALRLCKPGRLISLYEPIANN
jgi:hypothetical protein